MEVQEYDVLVTPKQPQTRHKHRQKHFADGVVYVSLGAVVFYTVACFWLQFAVTMEPSPTLTTCFFSFFAVELASLAAIKRGKNKHANKTSTTTAASIQMPADGEGKG